MVLDLSEVPRSVADRRAQWDALGVLWGELSKSPDDGRTKASAWQSFAASVWEGDIIVWDSGEVELSAVKRGGWHVEKHYDLFGPTELRRVLDDVVAMVGTDKIPAGAQEWHADVPPK